MRARLVRVIGTPLGFPVRPYMYVHTLGNQTTPRPRSDIYNLPSPVPPWDWVHTEYTGVIAPPLFVNSLAGMLTRKRLSGIERKISINSGLYSVLVWGKDVTIIPNLLCAFDQVTLIYIYDIRGFQHVAQGVSADSNFPEYPPLASTCFPRVSPYVKPLVTRRGTIRGAVAYIRAHIYYVLGLHKH